MASTFSPSLKLELIGNGDQNGTWGTTTNTNLGTLIEQAITGVQAITMANVDYTLSNLNGLSDEARNAVLVVGGTNSAVKNIIAPAVNKQYIIKNATIGGFAIVIKTSSSTGVSIANGATQTIYCDGTEFYIASFPSTGGTITGNLAVTGNLSTAGTLNVTGVPTIPTATAGTNTTQAASTAFVATAITAATGSLGTMSTQNANAVTITGGGVNVGVSTSPVRPLQVSGALSAESTMYVSSGLADNRIWNFLVSCASGAASGFQIRKLNDAGTVGTTAFSIDNNLNGSIAGSMTATSFYGSGGGLSGTAISLNAGIGVNQSWQAPGRAANTPYTNNTGKPIQVIIILNATAGGAQDFGGTLFVNGVMLAQQVNYASNAGYKTTLTAIVPAGSSYQMNFSRNASIDAWSELR